MRLERVEKGRTAGCAEATKDSAKACVGACDRWKSEGERNTREIGDGRVEGEIGDGCCLFRE